MNTKYGTNSGVKVWVHLIMWLLKASKMANVKEAAMLTFPEQFLAYNNKIDKSRGYDFPQVKGNIELHV